MSKLTLVKIVAIGLYINSVPFASDYEALSDSASTSSTRASAATISRGIDGVKQFIPKTLQEITTTKDLQQAYKNVCSALRRLQRKDATSNRNLVAFLGRQTAVLARVQKLGVSSESTLSGTDLESAILELVELHRTLELQLATAQESNAVKDETIRNLERRLEEATHLPEDVAGYGDLETPLTGRARKKKNSTCILL